MATTILSGLAVGGFVPVPFLVYGAVTSSRFDMSSLPSALSIVAGGGVIGFFLGGAVAAGAALLGTMSRDAKWTWLRVIRPVAPFLGASIALVWLPLLWAPEIGHGVWLFALIPTLTVGVTSWLPWAGGFMNPRAVERAGAGVQEGGDGGADVRPGRLRRSWGDVVLVVGSIVIITIFLVVLVLTASTGMDPRSPAASTATVLGGLGVISAAIAFFALRPIKNPEKRVDRHTRLL